MPQLDPNPWFTTMLMSWLTLSLIMQPKLLSFTSTKTPSNKTHTVSKTHSWTWPWT